MRLVVQRVREAAVQVDGQNVARIGAGLLVLWGLGPADTLAQAEKMLARLVKYRIFADDQGRMNRSLSDVQGELLLVSQFTLLAQTHKGLRPDFGGAMPPAEARVLFARITEAAQALWPSTQCGQFGADMQVSLINDGPVTLVLEG